MSFGSILASLLKGKIVAVAAVSIALVGGAAVAMAATSGGHQILQTSATNATQTATSGSDHSSNHHNQNDAKAGPTHPQATSGANGHNTLCPGLAEAQNLAGNFSLSTNATSDDVQAICTLHNGMFKGTTPDGMSVTSNQILGYGEINQLLGYAQNLAGKTGASGKLTSDNARAYLAAALRSCGTMSVTMCVKTNMPASSSDGNGNNNNENGNGHDNGNGNNNGHGNGNGTGGKPTSTPTPHS